MCVIAEHDLDVGELESELLDRFLNRRHISLVGRIQQDVPLWRDDEERAERARADVVDVGDDPMRRERGRLILRRAHVPRQDRRWCIGAAEDGHGRMVRRPSTLTTRDAASDANYQCRHRQQCRESPLEHGRCRTDCMSR
jgi:hypothetical protein